MQIDNKSAIDLANHPVSHGRSKHIETWFHFLRDQVNKGNLKLEYYNIEDHIAYIFTKSLKANRFHNLRDKFDVLSLSNSELRGVL